MRRLFCVYVWTVDREWSKTIGSGRPALTCKRAGQAAWAGGVVVTFPRRAAQADPIAKGETMEAAIFGGATSHAEVCDLWEAYLANCDDPGIQDRITERFSVALDSPAVTIFRQARRRLRLRRREAGRKPALCRSPGCGNYAHPVYAQPEGLCEDCWCERWQRSEGTLPHKRHSAPVSKHARRPPEDRVRERIPGRTFLRLKADSVLVAKLQQAARQDGLAQLKGYSHGTK